MTQDWASLLVRLEERGIDVTRILGVKRMQVWRWRHRVQKPNGDHAATLIALDMGQGVEHTSRMPVSP